MNLSSSSCYSNYDTPMSPILERTKKAIAQHRAWRQPDLRRSYEGISLSAASQRLPATAITPTSNSSPAQNDLNRSTKLNGFPNIGFSHSGSSSIPFDAAAAIYEDIELSESRLIHDLNPSDSVHDHLLQIENLMLSPSMRSNFSSTSDRSINSSNMKDEFMDASYLDEIEGNRLGIEANEIYDTNPSNEADLLKRQKYVYESYRSLQHQSLSMLQSTGIGTTSRESLPQPIIFRDDESVGTGMSQQELIRKKARTNRRKRLISKTKKLILQLPTQLLLPPRISTPHRQPYCAMKKKPQGVLPAPSKRSNKSKSVDYEQYDDPEQLESSSTTTETANESGDTSPGNTVQAVVQRPQSTDTTLITKDSQLQRRRRQQQPSLAVRGDDALLWVEPIDQRSLGEESYLTYSRDGHDDNNNTTEKLTKAILVGTQLSPICEGVSSKTIEQLPRTSVRFARCDGGREDDESSMPWDQKTDMKGTTLISPTSVLVNIGEEKQIEESTIKVMYKTVVPRSILRKSRYKASRIGELNGSDDAKNRIVEIEFGNHNEPVKLSRDLSPPRMPVKMLDLGGLDLSPIPHGLEPENQLTVEDSVDDAPSKYIGHPAEKHIQKTMATFLAMRDGELADHVRDQEIYPDPPLEIDVRMTMINLFCFGCFLIYLNFFVD